MYVLTANVSHNIKMGEDTCSTGETSRSNTTCKEHVKATIKVLHVIRIGSLSTHVGDGDGDDNGLTGLDQQNNNFANAARIFVHFFAVVARLRGEASYFNVF